MDKAASQSSKDAPSTTRPPRHRRGTATRDRAAKHNCRAIASHCATFPNDPDGQRVAIRENVMEGLVRKPRRTRDPNQVNIYVPPSFPLLLSETSKEEACRSGERDNQSESFNQSSSNLLTANSWMESTALSVEMNKVPTMPHFLTLGPMSILGAGRVDPFANYPIKMNREEEWLIDQSKFHVRT